MTRRIPDSATPDGSGRLPAVVGLAVAWGGTGVLVSPAAMASSDPSSLAATLLGLLLLWLLCAAVLAIVVFWERKPLESLWLNHFRWQSVAWAAVVVAGSVVVLFPATEWVRTAAGLPGYSGGMERALAQPVWVRLAAVVTAGVVEEILFRGYAVTRLAQLTGSLTLAVLLSSLVFAALHLPVWGPGPSLAFLIGGVATTAFFAWRHDLLAMIIAHVAIDAWGIVITPALSSWWL